MWCICFLKPLYISRVIESREISSHYFPYCSLSYIVDMFTSIFSKSRDSCSNTIFCSNTPVMYNPMGEARERLKEPSDSGWNICSSLCWF